MWHSHPHINPGIDACGNCTLNIPERTGFSHSLVSMALIFLGSHASHAMKRSRKASLRGEMRVERYLRDRQFARSQFRHRALQPDAAYIAVRGDAHGKCELTRKMKRAVTRYSSESCKRDVVPGVCRYIVENAAEPNVIETVRGGVGGRACPAIAMLLKESGRKRQRGCFDVHAAYGCLDC